MTNPGPGAARRWFTDLLGPLLAGALVAVALPPWDLGSAALGFGLWLHLLRDVPWRVRSRRSALVALGWFTPATVWMVDLTAPGWPVVLLLWAAGHALVGAAVPGDRRRRWVFPAAITLAELVRWSIPFGGVPIATPAMAEVGTPSDAVVRALGSPGLVLATAVAGVAVAGLLDLIVDRAWRERGPWITVAAPVAVWMVLVLVGAVAPRAQAIDTLAVAVVQGGGPQNTRADVCENRRVFERHVEATAFVEDPVDLIVWPEDVVHPSADDARTPSRCDQPLLGRTEAGERLAALAAEHDAVLVTGWFEAAPDGTANLNYALAMEPDGTAVDRYDKVRLVPFGEFVPLRTVIEAFSDELPGRDVRVGNGPAVLETSAGTLGVSISWEIFFDHRARDAILDGGQVLLNPTNGSSYWLTIVQSQQVASSRLRALETDRWVLQGAPTAPPTSRRRAARWCPAPQRPR